MNQPSFVHLHLHTEYSVVDGLVRIPQLIERASALQMPALAVTDQSNLFATVKFYRAAIAAGIKPIIGCDLLIMPDEECGEPGRLLLLCRDAEGYRNLCQIVTRSYLEGQRRGVPMVAREWLAAMPGGLIAIASARESDLAMALLAGNSGQARSLAESWQEIYGDSFHLELVRTGRAGEDEYIERAVELAATSGIAPVASNDVRFLEPADFEAHEARVCIHQGRTLDDPRRPRTYSGQQYLRSAREMAELFADLPEALENSVQIARRCNLELELGSYALPDFPVPEGTSLEGYLTQQAREGLERRLEILLDREAPDHEEQHRRYVERLHWELDVIIQMGFPGYFLIVADFIRWARENGIPVGPGRGSGAGSLVAYALGITDLDPLAYDLLFERFLNPERVSMPDFDIDFCMERRDEVIDYVARRYGRDRVSQIITYGSMAAKAVVRDVGRVLGHPYGFVDQIAKLIPFELKMTLDKALEESEELRRRYDEEEEVKALIDLARKLEGLTRNAGRHAGGVVIAPRPLTEFTALYCEEGASTPVTQFDMMDVESVGLVKFDFLGLRTLTIIDWAVQDINRLRRERQQQELRIDRIPLDDADTYELIQRASTTAVFQLESRGMKELIRRLVPDSFDDLIALVALFRPGPLQSGMVDDFIERKHGRQRVQYPHPDLEPILKPTYGVILYQEQVMQIAQVLAGYTLGGADLLRRAMGKKKPEEMAKQRSIFLEGAGKRGIEAEQASYIFDLMEKFAGYGFNKSHSAAYALVAYQTAWLKAHHPAAFMAAVLSSDMDNTDKVVGLIDECRQMGLEVAPPDLNISHYKFTLEDERTIRYGLGAIKGVGEAAIEALQAERERGGAYHDLFDLCRRVDTRKANKRVLEALIKAGALDCLGQERGLLMALLPEAMQAGEQLMRAQAAGQSDLFGLAAGAGEEKPALIEAPPHAVWSEEERLAGEKETLGLYLTGHPFDRCREELEPLISARLGEMKPDRNRTIRVAGLVVGLRTNATRRGRMAVATLDDGSARIEATAYSEVFERNRELLARDRILVIEGICQMDDFSGQPAVTIERVFTIDQARTEYARELELRLGQVDPGSLERLQRILQEYRLEQGCPVTIHYRRDGAEARLRLGGQWRARLTDHLLGQLRDWLGPEQVVVAYRV